MEYRELTDNEKKRIRQSVIRKCSCYDWKYGCLALDGDCYMMKIGYTNSSLCNHYERAILPTEPEFYEFLSVKRGNMKKCKNCGRQFAADGNKRYCSNICSAIARKKATAKRVKKLRSKRYEM